MEFSSIESAPSTSVSIIEYVPATQTSIGFLSLPPEVRLMVYDHLFVPEKDGTCRPIQYSHLNHRLEGCRVSCYECTAGRPHVVCEPTPDEVPMLFSSAFVIANGFIHTNILWTCATIYREATPSLLAHMNLSVPYYHTRLDLGRSRRALKRLLGQLQSPETPLLPNLTFRIFELFGPHPGKTPVTILNNARAHVGHLKLQTNGDDCELELVDLLLSFDPLPLSVEWTDRLSGIRVNTSQFTVRRFNKVANRWLKSSRDSKNDGSKSSLTKLLSQFSDQDD